MAEQYVQPLLYDKSKLMPERVQKCFANCSQMLALKLNIKNIPHSLL